MNVATATKEHYLAVPNKTGDLKTTWNPDVPAEVWVSWCAGTTSSTSVTCDVWASWVSAVKTTPYTSSRIQLPSLPHDPAVERQLRSEYEAEQRRLAPIRKKQVEEQLAANKRAEALLLDNLTPEQQAQYREGKHIIIVGGYSGTRYRVRHGRTGNIDVIDTLGRVSHRLCAHPREDMPDADCVLIQKLMIEGDEETFLKLANRHASFDRITPVLPTT